MSDDRSPVDGWFRGEPDADAPSPAQAPSPTPGQPPFPPRPFVPSPDDAPTQVGAIPAMRPVPGQPAYQEPVHSPIPDAYAAGAAHSSQPPYPQGQPPFPQAYPSEHPQWPGQPQWHGEPNQGAAFGRVPGQQQPAQPFAERQPVYSYPEYEPHPHDRRAGRARKPLLAGGAIAGAAALGLVAYLALSGGTPAKSSPTAGSPAAGTSPSPTHTAFQPTSADPAAAAEQTATAFLSAWQSGDLQAAAKYTDDPTDALAGLTAYKSGLNLSALQLKPQSAVLSGSSSSATASASASAAASSGSAGASASTDPADAATGTVPFSATAMVSMGDSSGTSGASNTGGTSSAMPWTYSSKLVAYKQSDGWSVRWSPSILAPGLADGQQLALVPVAPSVGKVVDASGKQLSSYTDSTLKSIAASLESKAPKGTGTPGVAVQVMNASGKAVGTTPLATLQKPVDASVLKTTINPTIQALADAAVAMHARSSMVVLRPSTGAILAVANTPGSGDTALVGGLAPGSTFKIVTSAALLNYGVVSLYSPVACPLTFTVQGVVYHNATDGNGKNEESEPPGTPFITDFAQSCNNAFTQFYKQMEGGKLAGTASSYFGLNRAWDIGLGPAQYFGMPGGSSGAELAQENFGQGRIVASPLAMASVAATVGTGSFHQPYLVSGVTKVGANPLPSHTAADLKTLMHAVVVNGTAAGVFAGVTGPLYAKTGTAETDANKDGKPNAWLVVYDPHLDVAIGTVVQDSGFGATYAGPEERYVLSRL